jgi:predicted unusual protein kinase regulating ubiquinone biosynthesis (AarF/ABC1/UbiB family)
MVDVDPVPIASASIGQVHVAHFKKSGEKVVLKIQHPFAKTLLLDDFRSLAMICRIWSFLEPEYKFFEILMNEWANEARKELDFLQEAQNLCEAQSTLEQMKQNEPQAYFITSSNSIPYDVEIPQPMLSLCTRKVLVMSFCEGVRIDKSLDLECSWLPKEDVMESVAQTFAHFMYNGTIFNGDPHPGNLFLRPGIKERDSREGGHNQKGFTLILLDWGLAKRLPPTKRIAFAQMAYAAATVDFGLLLDSFDLLGLKMKREDVHQDMDAIRFLLRELAPRIIARRRIKAKLRHNQVCGLFAVL